MYETSSYETNKHCINLFQLEKNVAVWCLYEISFAFSNQLQVVVITNWLPKRCIATPINFWATLQMKVKSSVQITQ